MRKAPGAAVAGLGAALIMKSVSSFLYERHSGQVREREDRLRPENADDSRGRGRQPVLVRAEVEGEKRG